MTTQSDSNVQYKELWKFISFPLGLVIGMIFSVVITIIVKGSECVA